MLKSNQLSNRDGFKILEAYFAPSWFLRYTPAGIIDKLTSSPVSLSHNNLNPWVHITKETICYKVTKETCRPTIDIVDITETPIIKKTSLHFSLIDITTRYSFTFTKGDKLYLIIHNNHKEEFQQYLAERSLSLTNK